jgi:hypothetical protein
VARAQVGGGGMCDAEAETSIHLSRAMRSHTNTLVFNMSLGVNSKSRVTLINPR